MKQITASQKIALLERRVAQLEKQAIFDLFKSKEEKVLKELRREIARETSVTKLNSLYHKIEDLDYDPDYAKYEKTIKAMLKDVSASIKVQKDKATIRKMMESESIQEFRDNNTSDWMYYWEENYPDSGLLEKEEFLFLKHLLEKYDKHFKLNVASRADGSKKGFVTIKGHKYRIQYGRKNYSQKWLLTINGTDLYHDHLIIMDPSIDFKEKMKKLLKR